MNFKTTLKECILKKTIINNMYKILFFIMIPVFLYTSIEYLLFLKYGFDTNTIIIIMMGIPIVLFQIVIFINPDDDFSSDEEKNAQCVLSLISITISAVLLVFGYYKNYDVIIQEQNTQTHQVYNKKSLIKKLKTLGNINDYCFFEKDNTKFIIFQGKSIDFNNNIYSCKNSINAIIDVKNKTTGINRQYIHGIINE